MFQDWVDPQGSLSLVQEEDSVYVGYLLRTRREENLRGGPGDRSPRALLEFRLRTGLW